MLLKFLRKRKNMKRIMWALAILIIPAFVIWGAGTSAKNKDSRPDYAGKVFGKKISYEDYNDMWNVARDNLVQIFGNNVPMGTIDRMAWGRILLLEEAKRQNMQVSDREVVEKITSFPDFQRKGSFDKKLYKSMLGDSARSFEEKLRDDLLISKLKDRITSPVRVSDEEVKDEYKKRFEKIKSSYGLIPFSESEKDVSYNDADLEKYYELNKESFKKNEQINVRYLEILYSRFDSEADIKDESIKRFFEEHVTDFKKSGSDENPVLDDNVKTSIHEKLAMEKKVSLAEELGYRALDQVAQKNNLEEPAMANSLEIKETGFFSIEGEIPGVGWSYEFASAGFSLKKDQINNMLIKTDMGLYIIQLKEKKEPYIPEYADVKDMVKKEFIKDASVKLSQKESEKIYLDISSVVKDNEGFKEVLKKYGFQAKETDFIDRNGYVPEIGPAKDFVDTAFSTNAGAVSRPLKTLQGWAIILPIEPKPIDEAQYLKEKEKFKENLLENKKDGEFNRYFEDLQKRSGFVSYTER